jgi:hypothetical protein
MSALSKTQFNRFYAQLDSLYTEIYRRLSNFGSTDQRAKDFQKRCTDQGVPKESIKQIAKIQATRVVGQGSAFMRKQAIDSLIPMAGALPEDGRDNLMRDKIAAEAGQSAVLRYYPRKDNPMGNDQQAEAMLQVAAMKIGVPPVITSNQNPLIFAMTFIQAAQQALQSLKQGGSPPDVLRFLNICGPAIAAHLQRFATDPTRAPLFKQLMQQYQQIAAATDELKKNLTKMGQQQMAQQQATQQAMTDEQLAQAKLQSDIQLKTVKTQAQLKQSQQKHDLRTAETIQNMRLKDAVTAHELNLSRLQASHQANLDRIQAENDMVNNGSKHD